MSKGLFKPRKSKFNLDELNALKVAYGKNLNKKQSVFFAIKPAVALGLLGYFIGLNWVVGLVTFLVSFLYGYFKLLPKFVKREYFIDSLIAKNMLLRSMSAQLSNESKTLVDSINQLTRHDRIPGELGQELKDLEAVLNSGSESEITEAFNILKDKYENDTVFVQFLVQMELVNTEGKASFEVFEDLSEHHNDIKEIQDSFMKEKNEFQNKLWGSIFGGWLAVGLPMVFFYGTDFYLTKFANTTYGTVVSIIFVVVLSIILVNFYKNYFDDSVFELGGGLSV